MKRILKLIAGMALVAATATDGWRLSAWADQLVVENFDNDSVTVYARTANGNASPLSTLSGGATGLSGPQGMVVDTLNNELVVTNYYTNTVTVYAFPASNNTPPLRTLMGATTGLSGPGGVVVDTVNDELVVANNGNNSVTVYPRAASNNTAPIRTLAGGSTGLSAPALIAVDTVNDELVVVDYATSSVAVYARTATGDTAPLRTLTGAATGLNNPVGVTLDIANDELIVTNNGNNSVTVYARTAAANTAPLRTLVGASTGLNLPQGVIVDVIHDELLVANEVDTPASSVTVYNRTATGDTAPLRTITGAATQLNGPVGLAIVFSIQPTPTAATPTPTLTPTSTGPTPTAPTPARTPVPLRHFQCYEQPREAFTPFSVSLADQFGPSTVSVVTRKRLCNPADKNGEDPNAPLDPNHLTGYVIKQTSPQFVPINRLMVTNQFGTVAVDVLKPEYLLVPAAKSLNGPPGPLANPAVGHFKCYRVRAKTRVAGLQLTDQFGTLTFDAKKPSRLCVPADKNGSGILDSSALLMCYKGRQTSLPRFRGKAPIFIDDQFGAATIAVDHLREFCVPSSRPCPAGPELARWNGNNPPSNQARNNCYNYGTNIKTDTFAQPGRATGNRYTVHQCQNVRNAAIRDGLTFIGSPPVGQPIPACPAGACLVALVVDPSAGTCVNGPNAGAACTLVDNSECPLGRCVDGDYHWYRLNQDGSWSHKPGEDPATTNDSSGNAIADPRTADRRYTNAAGMPIGVAGVDGYKDFCGFMCTGNTVVRSVDHEVRDSGAGSRVASNEVEALVLYYSGREDPGWTFSSASDIAEIKCRLDAAIAAAPGGISDPNWEGKLGTSGVRLNSGSATALPEQLTTFRNAIEVDDSGKTTFYSDVEQLGEMLRCRAITEGYAALVPPGSCGSLPSCP